KRPKSHLSSKNRFSRVRFRGGVGSPRRGAVWPGCRIQSNDIKCVTGISNVNSSSKERLMKKLVVLGFVLLAVIAGSAMADDYAVDASHTGVSFKASHIGLSWTHGRFNDVSGSFSFDPEKVSAAKFNLAIKVDSIDTGNAKRDDHLRAPDFFNAKQFPAITFNSTAVKSVKEGYQVTGDLTLHGVTKPVTFVLTGGKTAEFPKGTQRIGFSTE